MTYFLTLASNYESVNLALFQDETLIASDVLSKQAASKELINHLQNLLVSNNLTLSDITFCAVNQGPGPFTTLRTVIATANGLSFATGIPLVGVNELEAMLQEYASPHVPDFNSPTIVLLNAFNFDVYYISPFALSLSKGITGCMNIDLLLQTIKQKHVSQTIQFIGNGARLYRDKIETCFGSYAIIPDPLPESSSITQIGLIGLHNWRTQETICTHLQPIYLKQFTRQN